MIFIHFLITLLIILIVHEMGHLIAARALGIAVKTFSIGFGPVVLSFSKFDIKWQVGVFPLGGYVRFFESDELSVSKAHQSYMIQPIWKKSIVLLAGPFANFLLAYVIFFGVFLHGVSGVLPVIESVKPLNDLTFSNILPGDQILAVNGQKVHTVEAFNQALFQVFLDEKNPVLKIQRDDQNVLGFIQPKSRFLSKVVIQKWLNAFVWNMPDFLPVIGKIIDDSPAQSAGLKLNDQIVSADDIRMNFWDDWQRYIRDRANVPIKVVLLRDQKYYELVLTPDLKNINGQYIGVAGVGLSQQVFSQNVVWQRYGVLQSIQHAWDKLYRMVILNIGAIKGLFSGLLGLDHISSPISIAYYADQAASLGQLVFLYFVATLSISIGLLNLIPLPILDGGQFVLLFLEKLFIFKRFNLQKNLYFLSLILILALFVLAIYNDVRTFFV